MAVSSGVILVRQEWKRGRTTLERDNTILEKDRTIAEQRKSTRILTNTIDEKHSIIEERDAVIRSL